MMVGHRAATEAGPDESAPEEVEDPRRYQIRRCVLLGIVGHGRRNKTRPPAPEVDQATMVKDSVVPTHSRTTSEAGHGITTLRVEYGFGWGPAQ